MSTPRPDPDPASLADHTLWPRPRLPILTGLSHPQVHMKTMPAATYRLLTGQEQPVYL
jgi:hypothetical protein